MERHGQGGRTPKPEPRQCASESRHGRRTRTLLILVSWVRIPAGSPRFACIWCSIHGYVIHRARVCRREIAPASHAASHGGSMVWTSGSVVDARRAGRCHPASDPRAPGLPVHLSGSGPRLASVVAASRSRKASWARAKAGWAMQWPSRPQRAARNTHDRRRPSPSTASTIAK